MRINATLAIVRISTTAASHGADEANTYAPPCGIILDEAEHRCANEETLAAMKEPANVLPRHPCASEAKAELGF